MFLKLWKIQTSQQRHPGGLHHQEEQYNKSTGNMDRIKRRKHGDVQHARVQSETYPSGEGKGSHNLPQEVIHPCV